MQILYNWGEQKQTPARSLRACYSSAVYCWLYAFHNASIMRYCTITCLGSQVVICNKKTSAYMVQRFSLCWIWFVRRGGCVDTASMGFRGRWIVWGWAIVQWTVQVFLFGRLTAAQVPFGFVFLEKSMYLGGQCGIHLRQLFAYILVYRRFTDSKTRGCITNRALFFNEVLRQLLTAFLFRIHTFGSFHIALTTQNTDDSVLWFFRFSI